METPAPTLDSQPPAMETTLQPPPAEESAMATWNATWMASLESRRQAENEAKAKAIEQAEKDLTQFTAEREALREAKMAKNRSEEQVKLEALEADLESANSWSRIVKLIDLQQDENVEVRNGMDMEWNGMV